jgi:hypothetical protein
MLAVFFVEPWNEAYQKQRTDLSSALSDGPGHLQFIAHGLMIRTPLDALRTAAAWNRSNLSNPDSMSPCGFLADRLPPSFFELVIMR